MTVGVVGIGLIGGSFAKAYKAAGHRVLVEDIDPGVPDFAILSGVADGKLTQAELPECDLILLCVYPRAAVDWVEKEASHIGKHPIVLDACGVKRSVCDACFPLAERYGFTFLGGHPMAGTHNSGFKYADAKLFAGAPMVIVPPDFNRIDLLEKTKELLAPAGFGRIAVTTAQRHDETIAFTSQLAHLVSNAYIKSPTAKKKDGVSAGSYRDMTRVAWLSAPMWAELFLEDRDNLLCELDTLLGNLREYRDALAEKDEARLIRLLEDGKKRKEEVDGH